MNLLTRPVVCQSNNETDTGTTVGNSEFITRLVTEGIRLTLWQPQQQYLSQKVQPWTASEESVSLARTKFTQPISTSVQSCGGAGPQLIVCTTCTRHIIESPGTNRS